MSLYAPAAAHTVLGARVCAALAFAPTAPREARCLLRDALAEWELDHVAHTASLIVSELVTNAVLHGRAPLSLTAYVDHGADGGLLFLEVEDAGEHEPDRRDAGDDAEDGRGLAIVDELAAEWRCEPTDTGKRVWASISLDDTAEEAR